MRRLQEFSNEPDKYSKSAAVHIRRIEKLPLPYTGNKKKLLYHIHDAIAEHDIQFDTVLDAFAGSASVALLLKLMGKRVIANDLLTSSYLFSVAFVENPGIRLSEEEQEFLLNNENSNKGTFVEDNYVGKGLREDGKDCRFNKFTLREARHLDNFRANIDDLCGIHAQSMGLSANAAVIMRLPFGQVDASVDVLKHRKKQQEHYGEGSGQRDRRIGIYYDDEYNLKFDKWFRKYVEDFTKGIVPDTSPEKIKRAAFLANLQQHVLRDCMVQGRFHHGQALAELNVRLKHPKNQLKAKADNEGSTEMDFHTRAGVGSTEGRPGEGLKWWSFANMDFTGDCIATNMDVTDLLRSGYCNVDCVYFDPPYGGQSSDYSTIYRFLEEYVYSAPLEELPHIQAAASKFVKRKEYEKHFAEMLDAARHIPTWLFSYNDNSWKDIDYISDIIRQHRKEVTVIVLSDEYRYLYRKCQGRTNKSSEYLIVAR
jgi:adenine-specific DNA methylase